MLFWNDWIEIKNWPVVFTSTFLGKNPLTRQTRRTFNRSRANLNGPIRNTFIVFCWNQSETILLQGSPELLISLLYMSRRALGRDWLPSHHAQKLAQKTSGVESRLRWTAARLKKRSKTATVACLCFFSLRTVASVLGETTARRVVNFLIFFVQNSRDKRYYAK